MKTRKEKASVFVRKDGMSYGLLFWLDDYQSKDEFIRNCVDNLCEVYSANSGKVDDCVDVTENDLVFSGWDNVPISFLNRLRTDIDEKYWMINHTLRYVSNQDAFIAYCKLRYPDNFDEADMDNLVDEFEEAFIGYYSNEDKFAQEWMVNNYDVPDLLFSYINWGKLLEYYILVYDVDVMDDFYFRR